jgi:hypothetical protein
MYSRYQEMRAQIGTRSSDRWAGLGVGIEARRVQRVEQCGVSPPRFDLGSVFGVRNVPKPCVCPENAWLDSPVDTLIQPWHTSSPVFYFSPSRKVLLICFTIHSLCSVTVYQRGLSLYM